MQIVLQIIRTLFTVTIMLLGQSSNAQDVTPTLFMLLLSDDEGISTTPFISSAAFKNTGSTYFNLPLSYTCDGVDGGTSPLLSWSGVPDDATHSAITMHTVVGGSNSPQFTLFNIPSTVTTLPAGDFSIGTAAEGDMTPVEIAAAGGIPYSAPCAAGAGVETLYIFTLYFLSDELALTSTATQAQVTAAISGVLVSSTTLTARRIRYDDTSIANDLHVPTSVPSTCADKTAHFNEYSRVHVSVDCNTATNQLDIISHISDGLKTSLPDQQVQVGIQRYIGRLSLPSQTGGYTRIEPAFLSGVNNNLSCDGTGALGTTVDGQFIIPYYKQGPGPSGDVCGPADGINYATRDTIVLGEVDQCYGHSPNGEGYHLHGPPICLMDVHDPGKPLAYMVDGIPLYFGESGGTIENTTHAQSPPLPPGQFVTDTNFGAGLYEHLNYFPSDVKDGSNPLNECNAYDINGDGATSGYVYYTTKDAPYTIGCFMGQPLSSPSMVPSDNTRLLSERSGWIGQTVGEAQEVTVLANYYGTFNGATYNITEMIVNGIVPSYLEAGKTAQVLWRVDSTNSTTTCFEFRYRKDKDITNSDETETICTDKPVPATTLDFTPFG